MTKMLKIHDNVYEDLTIIKKDGETFSETIYRLLVLYQMLQKVQGISKN